MRARHLAAGVLAGGGSGGSISVLSL